MSRYSLAAWLVTIVVAIMIAGLACSDDCTLDCSDDLTTSDVIMPLALGNEWTYELTQYDASGIAEHRDTITESLSTGVRVGAESWSKLDAFADEPPGDSAKVGSQVYLCNRENGLWSCFDPLMEGAPKCLRIQYPGKPGDVWLAESREITLLTIDTLISVPSGTFRCHHYYYELVEFTYEESIIHEFSEFWAPGVGEVRSQGGRKSNDGHHPSYALELLSYRPGRLP